MTKTTRLAKAINLELPDRPPILGGWLAAPNHICQLTGCSEDDYWRDQFYWGLEAERILGSDGLIDLIQPVKRGDFRVIDEQVLEERARYSVAEVLREIAQLPSVDEVRSGFDLERAYEAYIEEYRLRQTQCGDIVWCPADWKIIPHGLWYHEFGYETALLTLGLHPERYRELIRVSAEEARQRAELIARAIRDGIHPPAVFTGEDLCSQQGSMVSPAFLRREYFPLVEYTLEPLLEVGAKIVWHCDGNYRPLLADLLACGISGLQGFQKECGMDLEWIVDLKTRQGEPLLIFGPMSVTTALPYGTVAEIKAEVAHAMTQCRDKASLLFFTSNTITPDTPLENIRAFWDAVLNNSW